MDFLNGDLKKIYIKYLINSFWGSLVICIYSLVDTAMVGQYCGPDGTAALAIVSPIWSIICSFGFFFGVGAVVFFASLRGESKDNYGKANEFFTAGLILVIAIAIFLWLVFGFFDKQILMFCGADEKLLPIAHEYVSALKWGLGIFPIEIFLTQFVRNDGNPVLVTASRVTTAIFNIVGDYFFVFVLDMGAYGAGVATFIAEYIGAAVIVSHFFLKRNTIRLKKPSRLANKSKKILFNGFSAFIVDLAGGIIAIFMNTQIMKYLDSDSLAVYGVVLYLNMFVVCCSYAVGQGAQPIISNNYGAKNIDRIFTTFRYSVYTLIFFALFSTTIAMLIPNAFVHLFMDVESNGRVLEIAPEIIRLYALSFILIPLNIFSTYYFQSLMKPKTALAVALGRGAIVSGIMIMLLPLIFPAKVIWLAMPITEVIVCIYVVTKIREFNRRMKAGNFGTK